MNCRVGKGACRANLPVGASGRACAVPTLRNDNVIEPSCSAGGRGMTCTNPRGHGGFRAFAHPTLSALAMIVIATIAAQVAALAQGLDVKRYNPSEWTNGR